MGSKTVHSASSAVRLEHKLLGQDKAQTDAMYPAAAMYQGTPGPHPAAPRTTATTPLPAAPRDGLLRIAIYTDATSHRWRLPTSSSSSSNLPFGIR